MAEYGFRPRQVVLLRHAEKTGRPGDRGLSPRGQARAVALAEVIPERLDAPEVLIACRSSTKSTRPVDTVRPLAARLGLDILDPGGTWDIGPRASAVSSVPVFAGRRILVCWRHDSLQQRAQAFGAVDAPSWPATLSDRLWILEHATGPMTLREVAQAIDIGIADNAGAAS